MPPDSGSAIILDACLSYIVHLRKNHPKSYIAEATARSFDPDSVKLARKLIFEYAIPVDTPKYRGLNAAKHPRDKILHCFEPIWEKLVELDAEGKMPVVACPSDKLHVLPSLQNLNDYNLIERRFQGIESNMEWIKSQFDSLQFMSSLGVPPDVPRERLDSSVSTKRPLDLSDSSEDDSSGEMDLEFLQVIKDGVSSKHDMNSFKQPKYNVRKEVKKLRRNSPSPRKGLQSWADKAKQPPSKQPPSKQPPTKKPTAGQSFIRQRKPLTWGKCEEDSDLLVGVPPDIFISHCRRSIDETNVKDFFAGKSIVTEEVKKMSPEGSYYNSFRVSVKKYADFKSIMSGDLTPPEVGVRIFRHPRKFNKPSSRSDPLHVESLVNAESKPSANEGKPASSPAAANGSNQQSTG